MSEPVRQYVEARLRQWFEATRKALEAERLAGATIDRVLRRLLYGDPEGPRTIRVHPTHRPRPEVGSAWLYCAACGCCEAAWTSHRNRP